MEEHFEMGELKVLANKVQYRDICATKIIFCDGISGESNPYFKNLPFASNKGEALVIETDRIPSDFIFKKGLSLVPLTDNYWWVGASYEWDFRISWALGNFQKKDDGVFIRMVKDALKIRRTFRIIRPATLERRPFVGFHPSYENVGILNGMGTKGCSLAPFFASQMANQMAHGAAIIPDAGILRFKNILGK